MTYGVDEKQCHKSLLKYLSKLQDFEEGLISARNLNKYGWLDDLSHKYINDSYVVENAEEIGDYDSLVYDQALTLLATIKQLERETLDAIQELEEIKKEVEDNS